MAAVLRAMAAARAAEAEQAKAPPLSEEEQALLEQVLAEAEEGAAGLVRVLPPERLPVRAVLSAELLAAARAAEAGAEYARRERARAEEALSHKGRRRAPPPLQLTPPCAPPPPSPPPPRLWPTALLPPCPLPGSRAATRLRPPARIAPQRLVACALLPMLRSLLRDCRDGTW